MVVPDAVPAPASCRGQALTAGHPRPTPARWWRCRRSQPQHRAPGATRRAKIRAI